MVRDDIFPPRRQYWRLLGAPVMAMAMTIPLGGCTSSSYLGISLKPGMADSAVQELARRASSGDKPSQLRLGMYYQYAADGVGSITRDVSLGQAQPADVQVVQAIFDLARHHDNRVGQKSWRLAAMQRAAELYRLAATDSGGERLQITPAAEQGGAVKTSRISTGPLQKGLPEAAARLAVIEDAIFREGFATDFNDPYSEVCQDAYTYEDWLREAYFVVKGKIVYRTIPDHHLSVARQGDHFAATIDVERFIKWPEKFPKFQKLAFDSRVIYGQILDEHTGDYRGCDTWTPPRGAENVDATIILQYRNVPVGAGKFEILKIFE